jgi:pilus assembly protein Flp/PilA
MPTVLHKLLRVLGDEQGQGLVEYALIIALVSIVAIAALKTLGTNASSTLSNAAHTIG